MNTPSAVTLLKKPPCEFRIHEPWAEQADKRARRQQVENDAWLVAFALNACRGNAAYGRLTALLRDLEKLRAETVKLKRVRRMKGINRRLAQYTFHPCVGLVAGFEGRFGITSLSESDFFPGPANQPACTEADAALSLARLHAMGDLGKVRLCEVCRERWMAANHSNYRFCSKECRERFFQSQPDYHQRKARNQRRHRENLKRMRAAQDAARKGRK